MLINFSAPELIVDMYGIVFVCVYERAQANDCQLQQTTILIEAFILYILQQRHTDCRNCFEHKIDSIFYIYCHYSHNVFINILKPFSITQAQSAPFRSAFKVDEFAFTKFYGYHISLFIAHLFLVKYPFATPFI